MANNLPIEKKVTAVSMLAEGNSVRSIECMPFWKSRQFVSPETAVRVAIAKEVKGTKA